MFHLRVRANSDGANTSLDQFTLIEIKSLPGLMTCVTRPPSWRLRTGFDVARDLNKQSRDRPASIIWTAAPGVTFALGSRERFRWYTFAEMGAQTGPVFSSGFRVGAGARTGVAFVACPRWRMNADAAIRRYGWGDSTTVNSLEFEQAVSLTSTWEWRAKLGRDNHARTEHRSRLVFLERGAEKIRDGFFVNVAAFNFPALHVIGAFNNP